MQALQFHPSPDGSLGAAVRSAAFSRGFTVSVNVLLEGGGIELSYEN